MHTDGPAGFGPVQAVRSLLPAALLARLLGIHIKVAVAWQHASAGDWTAYAADYSRRQRHTTKTLDRVGHGRS